MMKQLKISQKMTVREGGLESYLSDIAKIPLLTPDEETSLAIRIQKGDEVAFNKLVRANLRFVVSVAKQYMSVHQNLMDLIQEGNIGLSIAARKFDHTKGFKFISYAVWWVRQSIISYLSSFDKKIRMPLNKVGMVQAYNKFADKYEVENGIRPSLEEAAEHLHMDVDKLADTLSYNTNVVSIDNKLNPDDGDSGTLGDVLPNGDAPTDYQLDAVSCDIDIERVLACLPERNREYVKLYFGFNGNPKTYDEISQMYDLTRERVRQIVTNSLRALKNSKHKDVLKKYIG